MNKPGYSTSPYYVGKKVEVDIPLPNTQTFSEWAIVNEIDDDLVSLQLSRDMLPDGVSLRVGQVLTIRSEYDCQIHTSRCFIVSMGFDQQLLLRLTSGNFSGKEREFYRVDAFLPIKYRRLHDHNPANVKKQWEGQKKWRQDDNRDRELRRLEAKRRRQRYEERTRELKLQDSSFPGEPTEVSKDKVQEELQYNQYDDLLPSAKTAAVSISGGGLRISTRQMFDQDELIQLEIFVPSLRLIVDVVARVVFSNNNALDGNGESSFKTGMQFVFIDESARFAINSHIGSLQLSQIRHFKGFADVEPLKIDRESRSDRHYAYIDEVEASAHTYDSAQTNWRPVFRQAVLWLFVSCVISLTGFSFYSYITKHPKSEIQIIFEHAIGHRGSLPDTLWAPAAGR